MIPNEASRELARVAAVVRSTGRRIALWRGAIAGIPLLAILVATGLLPREWLARPGSFLPMALASLGLSTFAVAGLVAGFSIRANRLRRVVPEQISGRIADECKACGMALGKTVLTEAADLLINALGELGLDALRLHACNEFFAMFFYLSRPAPGGHRWVSQRKA